MSFIYVKVKYSEHDNIFIKVKNFGLRFFTILQS